MRTVSTVPSRNPAGHLIDFWRDPVTYLTTTFSQYGETARLRFGWTRVWATMSPNMARRALLGQSHNLAMMTLDHARLVFGDGLITTNDEQKYRDHRGVIEPMLSYKASIAYAPEIYRLARAHVSKWRDGEVRNLSEDIDRITLDVVLRVLFDWSSTYDELGEILRAVRIGVRTVMARTTSPINLPLEIPLRPHREFQGAARLVHEVVNAIVDRPAVVGVAEKLKDAGFSRREVFDEVITLIMAGHETVSAAVSWALFLTCTNHEVYRSVMQQVRSRNGDLHEFLKRHGPLDAAIFEALRLYPPAWFLSRRVVHKTQMGEIALNKGDLVFVSLFNMQRNPEYFQQGSDFAPMNYGTSEWNKTAFLPFGLGNRICVGRHFALLEAKLLMMAILERFSIAFPISPVPSALLSIRIAGGLHGLVHEIEKGRPEEVRGVQVYRWEGSAVLLVLR